MTTQKYTLIPTLSTPAGSCLTAENWRDAGVDCVSYSLTSLVIKPGMAYLAQLPDWTKYTGWSGDWVLNASMETAPSIERKYTFRSPYDGARLSCSMDEIVAIIMHLKPVRVILPIGFHAVGDDVLHTLSEITRLFVPIDEQIYYSNHYVSGLYYECESAKDMLDSIAEHQLQFPNYGAVIASAAKQFMGTDLLKLDCSATLTMTDIFFESNVPAEDAYFGRVYTHEGVIELQNNIYATQFEPIDSTCSCPTCKQKLTRAYLHHLLEHTPLLCQRLLIQHNVYYLNHT